MGALGILHAAGVAPHAFDLDAEYTLPAFYSGLLLAVAAAMAFMFARDRTGADRLPVILIAGALAFLSLDEVLSFHERIDFHTDVDWQVLYLPLGVAFVWALWRVTRFLGRRGAETRLIFAGLVAWVVAQALEAAANSEVFPALIQDEKMSRAEVRELSHSVTYYLMAIPEELLEMTGSLLLAVAFALAVDRLRPDRELADQPPA